MASRPQGQQNLGWLRAQPPRTPREYKHHSLLGLSTKGSSNGYICKTHNTHQSGGRESRSLNVYHQTPEARILLFPTCYSQFSNLFNSQDEDIGIRVYTTSLGSHWGSGYLS